MACSNRPLQMHPACLDVLEHACTTSGFRKCSKCSQAINMTNELPEAIEGAAGLAASIPIKDSSTVHLCYQQMLTLCFIIGSIVFQIPVTTLYLCRHDIWFKIVGEDAIPPHWPAFQNAPWSHGIPSCMAAVSTNTNAGSATTYVIYIHPEQLLAHQVRCSSHV